MQSVTAVPHHTTSVRRNDASVAVLVHDVTLACIYMSINANVIVALLSQ